MLNCMGRNQPKSQENYNKLRLGSMCLCLLPSISRDREKKRSQILFIYMSLRFFLGTGLTSFLVFCPFFLVEGALSVILCWVITWDREIPICGMQKDVFGGIESGLRIEKRA